MLGSVFPFLSSAFTQIHSCYLIYYFFPLRLYECLKVLAALIDAEQVQKLFSVLLHITPGFPPADAGTPCI
jgi:hypothetical protein